MISIKTRPKRHIIKCNVPCSKFKVSLLLLRIIKCDVASFTCTDSHGILYRNYKNSTITNLAGTGCLLDGIYRFLYVLVAHDTIQQHSLNTTGIIHDTTIDTSLSHLALSSYIVVREPLDVGGKQCFLYILKLSLTDDSFDLFHIN